MPSSSQPEIRVHSWHELQEALFTNSWNPGIGRFRSHHAFRGLGDAQSQLDTSLIRLGGDYPALERHLLRNFRKYAHGSVVEQDSFWHWLSVAQHHGLPTRLLDWTNSPFVALHFATDDLGLFDRDAAVWIVDYTQVHKLIPDSLRQHLDREGANIFTVEMLTEEVGSFDTLRRFSEQSFIFFFEPPSIDERIYNQYAFFSIASQADLAFDRWLAEHPGVWRKVVIPAALKWEVRDKVDLANVNERTLFPGLGGLCSWLRRYYSPRHIPEPD